MTRYQFILRVTLREFVRGQYYWFTLIGYLLLIFIAASFSELGPESTGYLFQSFVYYFATTLTLVVSALIGSHQWNRDFSRTGLAELLCNHKTSGYHLFLARWISYALAMFLLIICLFALLTLGEHAFAIDSTPFSALMQMFCKTVVYGWLAYTLSATLGIIVRPPLAFLSTILMFIIGNVTEVLGAVASFDNSRSTWSSETLMPIIEIIRLWKPQVLIQNHDSNSWVVDSISLFASQLAWGMSACAFLLVCAWFFSRSQSLTQRWQN